MYMFKFDDRSIPSIIKSFCSQFQYQQKFAVSYPTSVKRRQHVMWVWHCGFFLKKYTIISVSVSLSFFSELGGKKCIIIELFFLISSRRRVFSEVPRASCPIVRHHNTQHCRHRWSKE